MDYVKRTLDSINTSIMNTVTRVTSLPEEAMCANGACKYMIPLPWFVYAWTCPNKHVNSAADVKCRECPAMRVMYVSKEPACVECPKCNTVTGVGSSNFGASLGASLRSAPGAIADGISLTYNSTKELFNRPSAFPCQKCGVAIRVPKGAWKCTLNNCNTDNTEDAENCVRCLQGRLVRGLPCGACLFVNEVPNAGYKAAFHEVVNSTKSFTDNTLYNLQMNYELPCGVCKNLISVANHEADISLYCSRCNNVTQHNHIPKDMFVTTVMVPVKYENTVIAEETQETPVMEAVVDADGNAVVDEEGNPVMQAVVDEEGKPVMQTVVVASVPKEHTVVQIPQGIEVFKLPFEVPKVCHDSITGTCTHPDTCYSYARTRCLVCHLTLCNEHACYLRTHPLYSNEGRQAVCGNCIVPFDNHYMPAEMMAKGPTKTQAEI